MYIYLPLTKKKASLLFSKKIIKRKHKVILDLYAFRENTINMISEDTYSYLESPPEINLRDYRK